MAELPNKCFAKQSKLKHLQMDFNQIANITNETFFGLKSLTHLSLRGNLLTSLNDELVSLTEVSSLYWYQPLTQKFHQSCSLNFWKANRILVELIDDLHFRNLSFALCRRRFWTQRVMEWQFWHTFWFSSTLDTQRKDSPFFGSQWSI